MSNQPPMPYNTQEQQRLVQNQLFQLDPSKQWQVVIEPLDIDRSTAQRALDWVWAKQLSNELGGKPENWRGHNKLRYLIPLYHQWGGKRQKRAEFIQEVLHKIPSYSVKVAVACDMVRTNDLTIKQMAEYLTIVQREAAQQGVNLESNYDLEFKSLLESNREAK